MSAGLTGMCHHAWLGSVFLKKKFIEVKQVQGWLCFNSLGGIIFWHPLL
jgi:hypothetical protein